MKLKKSIILCLLIAASVGGVSSAVSAEADKSGLRGRVRQLPTLAVDKVIGKIQAALTAARSGAQSGEVANLIRDAMDASGEIKANDQGKTALSTARGHLKAANADVKTGNFQSAVEHLGIALDKFREVKGAMSS